MFLNKKEIYLNINKNISIFRIKEEDYNDIICSINKNEILFDEICVDSYQVFINIFSNKSEKRPTINNPSFYNDHILILNSIPNCLKDFYVKRLLEKSLMTIVICDGIFIEKELIMNRCYRNQINLNIVCI